MYDFGARWVTRIFALRAGHCKRPKGVKRSPRSGVGDGFGLRPRHDREGLGAARWARLLAAWSGLRAGFSQPRPEFGRERL
jgi:hypothetical protein